MSDDLDDLNDLDDDEEDFIKCDYCLIIMDDYYWATHCSYKISFCLVLPGDIFLLTPLNEQYSKSSQVINLFWRIN